MSISDFIMPRATFAELIALCRAVRLLAMPRSDRQYTGVIFEKKKLESTERTIK